MAGKRLSSVMEVMILRMLNIFLECQIFSERVATPSHGEQPVVTAPAEV